MTVQAQVSRGDRLWSIASATLRNESAILFAAYMVGNVIAYGYQILMSRALQPADYGALVTLTSVYYVFTVIIRAIQTWMIGAVAGAGGALARDPRSVVLSAMRVVVPVAALAFGLHWIGSVWAAEFLHLGSPTPVKVLGLYVATDYFQAIFIGLALGLNKLRVAAMFLVVEPIVRVVSGLAYVHLGLGVSGAMAGFPTANVVVCAIAIVLLYSVLTGRHERGIAQDSSLGIDRYAVLLLVANVCLMVLANLDQLLVKHFFPEDVAGTYALAFVLGRVISLSTIALAVVIFTRSSNMSPTDPARAGMLLKAIVLVGLMAGGITTAYLALPGLFIRILGGAQYSEASGYIGLIAVEMALYSLAYIQAYYHLSVRRAEVIWALVAAIAVEYVLLVQHHEAIWDVLHILIGVMGGLLLAVSLLSWWVLRRTSALSRADAVADEIKEEVSAAANTVR